MRVFVLDYASLLALQQCHMHFLKVNHVDLYVIHPEYMLEDWGLIKLEYDKDVMEIVNAILGSNCEVLVVYGVVCGVELLSFLNSNKREEFLCDTVNEEMRGLRT